MRRTLLVFAVWCCSLALAGLADAGDATAPPPTDPTRKHAVPHQEAASVAAGIAKPPDPGESGAQVEGGSEPRSGRAEAMKKVAASLEGLKFSGLWYLSYQNGEIGNASGGTSYSRFVVKRGYLTLEKELSPRFQARVTADVTSVQDQTSSFDGSLAMRIKYLYGQVNLPRTRLFTRPLVELGVVHTPWLDFEEHLNYYRAQDPMFLERNGISNSADYGITVAGLLGGVLSADYQKRVNGAYPGRYGSVEAGVYNGGGYAVAEKNENKVVEGRLSVRPLPDILPGFQLSGFGLTGKGNTARRSPGWDVALLFASFEHPFVVLTGQYYAGRGNQQGTDGHRKEGHSFFAEAKPLRKVSLIGRFDRFDPNTRAARDENRRYIAGIAYHLRKPDNTVLLDGELVRHRQPGVSDDRRAQLTWQIAF